MNALRPRIRPDYRTACVPSRHHRRCSSVRSPPRLTAAASRRETRSPPSSLRKLRCGVGRRVHRRSHIPRRGGSPCRFAPMARRPRTDRRSRSRRVHAHAIPAAAPAPARRFGMILHSARARSVAAAGTVTGAHSRRGITAGDAPSAILTSLALVAVSACASTADLIFPNAAARPVASRQWLAAQHAWPRAHTSRRVHAHAIPGPEPACQTALREDNPQRRSAGLAERCQSLRLVAAVPHPARYGHRRSFAAEASRRETRRPPSSLRRLRCGVGLRVHRRSNIPQRGASPRRFAPRARRPMRMATGSHFAARACARHTGTGTGLPNGVTGRQSPAPFGRPCGTVPVASLGGSRPASGPVRSPPLVCRRGTRQAVTATDANRKRPSPPGCVPSPCPPAAHHAHSNQHQCKLPRQLSAATLPRAFAPRRDTSGLVRIPPASDAYVGESHSVENR